MLVVPDNTKTGVTKPCRYDRMSIRLIETSLPTMVSGVMPARPYKPRDKAVVERRCAEWLSGGSWRRCGCSKFFSLADANQAIGELLHRLNHRPFRASGTAAAPVSLTPSDKPALQPLPRERVPRISEWERARVNIDYHVAFDGNYYRNVPYNLVHEVVEIRATATTVEILHQGGRVASHVRSRGREKAVTNQEHRPKEVIRPILESGHRRGWCSGRRRSAHIRRDYLRGRSWRTSRTRKWGIADVWGSFGWRRSTRMYAWEAAAERALLTGRVPPSQHRVDPAGGTLFDRQPLPPSPSAPTAAPPPHDNIRGAEYFPSKSFVNY